MKRRILAILAAIILLLAACASPPPGSAESLVLHPKSKKLTLGLSVSAATHLSVEVLPAGAVTELTWSSSNPRVATVDDRGFVTALTPGKVRITVRDAVTGEKSTCSLQIDSMPMELTLRAEHITLKVKRSYNLAPSISPKQYVRRVNQAITWTSSDPGVATVDIRGRVTSIAPGTALIRGETINGLAAECLVTVE